MTQRRDAIARAQVIEPLKPPGPPKREGLTDKEIAALKDYASGGYRRINSSLREGAVAESDWPQIKTIDGAIKRLETNQDGTLYRGETLRGSPLSGRGGELAALGPDAKAARIRDLVEEHVRQQHPIGSTYEDRAFVSTSKVLDPALDASSPRPASFGGPQVESVVYKIEGGRGLDMAGLSKVLQFDDEAEVILARGSRFEVVSVARETLEHAMGSTHNRIVVTVRHLR